MAYPPAPDGLIIYSIGDIHGRSDCLRRAFDTIDIDKRKRNPVRNTVEVLLGDYVDRGPDSRGVLDMIIERSQHTPLVCLTGNHELMFKSYLEGRLDFSIWRNYGGLQALLSYELDPFLLKHGGPRLLAAARSALPILHKKFLTLTRSYLKLGRYCFVHAGIKPGVVIEKQAISDLTLIRRGFLDCEASFGFIVVHGHSPVSHVDFRHNRVNIDTGAYATNRLAVIRIDERGPMLIPENNT
jgi:serine/threonine protein phosphatase 1